VRQFLQAGLIDFMHLVIVPVTLGSGVSLWEGSSYLEDRFTIESVTSPSPVFRTWGIVSGVAVGRCRAGRAGGAGGVWAGG
jgi:hypothetical protein